MRDVFFWRFFGARQTNSCDSSRKFSAGQRTNNRGRFENNIIMIILFRFQVSADPMITGFGNFSSYKTKKLSPWRMVILYNPAKKEQAKILTSLDYDLFCTKEEIMLVSTCLICSPFSVGSSSGKPFEKYLYSESDK